MSLTIDRRGFLGSVAAALGSALPRGIELLFEETTAMPAAEPRVAVLSEAGFPTLDAQPVATSTLREATSGLEVEFMGVADLHRLNSEAYDVLITHYGSAFPKGAWSDLIGYLSAGGNWVNLGGAPLAVPVAWNGDEWQPEVRQTAYHRTCGITQEFRVALPGPTDYRPDRDAGAPAALAEGLQGTAAYALYYRFTRQREFPDEDGSTGARDATVRPLVSAFGGGYRDHPIAAPIVEIDRLIGPFAGGRWIFVTLDGTLGPGPLRLLLERAALGSHRLRVRPGFACYREGETPAIEITVQSPGAGSRPILSQATCRLELLGPDGRALSTATGTLTGDAALRSATVAIGPEGARLEPGLYRVSASVSSEDAQVDGLAATTGFWMYDPSLLAGGESFSTDRYSLRRGGKPYMVTGTSHMASDVQRKFLQEPNPHVWDRDFAAMKRAGVNMVRTGIWTGWRVLMPEVGSVDEAALRALDAFMLTARKHDIPVIFTFFAFLPEAWGGENPYLDPAAVAAQKVFLRAIAGRFNGLESVIWDLINEPSFCSAENLWLTRPNYDRHERAAWREWLRERYGSTSDEELASILSERWRTLPDRALELPSLDEFADRHVFESRSPLKVVDYRLFAQEMFRRWAAELAATLLEAGSPDQLITVGQDEGGTYERPAPMFHGDAVDFTSNHTWWFNDDLLWDSVMTKTPDRPNLISETGVMFYEGIDGSAWRSEREARDLLERKLVLAICAGGAGFIEWLWATNPYMPSDNEAGIGMLRADGSAKPELAVFRNVAGFAARSLADLGTREREPALMVIPHSHIFSVRNFATEATRRAVRAIHYRCRVTMSAASEYALDGIDYAPRLVILPSPRVLAEEAWQRILDLARAGATLLITGPIESDSHWRPISRLEPFGIDSRSRPVAQEEQLEIDGVIYRLSYRGEKIQRVEKALIAGSSFARVIQAPIGRGRLIWATLPVELAEQIEPTVALYRLALRQANVVPGFSLEEDDPGILVYPALYDDVALYGVVSESGVPRTATFTHGGRGREVSVTLASGRAALLLLGRADGRVLARYPSSGPS